MEQIKNLKHATGQRVSRFVRGDAEDFIDERNLPAENADHSIFDGMQIERDPWHGPDELRPDVLDIRNVPIWRREGYFAKPGEFSWHGAHHMPTDCELGVCAPPGVTDFYLARDNPDHPLANTIYGQKNWWKTTRVHPDFGPYGAINNKNFMISPEKQEAEWAAHRLFGTRGGNRRNNTRRGTNRRNNTRRKNNTRRRNNTRRKNNTRRRNNTRIRNNTRRRNNTRIRNNTRRRNNKEIRE
jgi:hypothetical protein